MTLEGNMPNEVYLSREAANEQARFELRKRWSRDSPCAKPQVEIEGEPGDPILLEIDCLESRRHLSIIKSRRAALATIAVNSCDTGSLGGNSLPTESERNTRTAHDANREAA
ncbi:MAG: hypothetical protein ACI9HK_001141 [Pirellulaceae bacterium]|jgi:hypothetical protein